MKRIYLPLCLLLLSIGSSIAQSVPFPPEPPYNTLAPWGYEQVGTNWDTSPYLPFKYQGLWFRIIPPNGVTYNAATDTWTNANPGTKYPLMVFNTGAGERGDDNNAQLKHGGQQHRDAVLSGRFPGFVVYWQTENGFLEAAKIQALLTKLQSVIPVDENRIYTNGFSRGGTITWQFVRDLPRTFAAAFPMSAASGSLFNLGSIHIPVRLAQGGKDTNPYPFEAEDMVEEYAQYGGSMEYYYFESLGHGTWNTCYALPDFFEWFLAQKKNQIHVFFGETEVCPGDPVNIRLGMTAGFDGYEWEKDGVVMGATTNEITATSFGSYRARFRRGSTWTGWSEPVVISIKPATQTPDIQITGLKSKVIPSVDGSTSVPVELPAGYEEYTWKNVATQQVLGTSRNFVITTPGVYSAIVKEFGGCSALDSPPFTVVNAAGPNAPDGITNFTITPVGKTTLNLAWQNNPTPVNNETGFEIYRADAEAGPYQLVAINPADDVTYSDLNLISSRVYYYKIRPINNTAAGPVSAVASALTGVDDTPPSPPSFLTVTSSNSSSIGLSWGASTDDVGVVSYDIYANGIKANTTSSTTFTVNSLTVGTVYNLVVRARDAAGNVSSPSQQVTTATIMTGLNYKYYQGDWNNVPDFNALTPVSTGWVNNFTLAPRLQNDYFGFVFEGKILVPRTGSYRFFLSSDDGSKLYIDGVMRVNYDGLHGAGEVAGAYFTLSAGVHDIKVEQFEKTGGEALTVRWQGPQLSKRVIANSSLTDVYSGSLTLPSVPAGLVASASSYDQINITWTPNTPNATSIEVYASTNGSNWSIIKTLAASSSGFNVTGLTPNTNYFYRLRAISSSGESAYTSTVSALTLNLPPVPESPTNVSGLPTSNSILLTWTDNATNENSYEVYKAAGTPENFQLVEALPLNAHEYEDSGLYPHTQYYYQIFARNITGISESTDVLSISTSNSLPVFGTVNNHFMRYDEDKSVHITVSDADGDLVFLSSPNLPDFAELYDYGDGTAELILEPTIDDLGTYPAIEIIADDGFGGLTSKFFDLEINSNHSPLLNTFPDVVLGETYKQVLTISATDVDGGNFTWQLTDLPAFVTYNQVDNDLELTIWPGETDAGSYITKVTVLDENGSSDERNLNITVSDYDPSFHVYINLGPANSVSGLPWNNTGVGSATNGFTLPNLVTNTSDVTGISFSLQSDWNSSSNNQGVPNGFVPTVSPYTYNVMNSYFSTSGTPETIVLSGLNPANKFNLEFFAGRNSNGNRTTVVTIDGVAKSVNAAYNTTEFIRFENVVPSASGEISISVAAGPGASFGYLNSIAIESFYDGNTPPEAPTNFAVAHSEEGNIELSWVDVSPIESGYEVYKSLDGATFSRVAILPANTENYIDTDFLPFVLYYYNIRAINGNGTSTYTDTLSISGLNRPVVIEPVPVITMSEDQTKTVRITASDPDGDDMIFFLDGAPMFAMLQDVSAGVVDLILNPIQGDLGQYSFSIVGMDMYGEMAFSPITVNVSDIEETYVYINFTDQTGANLAGSPWNNTTGANRASAGYQLSNMLDNLGNATTMDMQLVDAWNGHNSSGVTSGIYESNVTHYAMWSQENDTGERIMLLNLDPTKLYDLTFFGSRYENGGATQNRNTTYSSGGYSVTLNASNNFSETVSINGLRPSALGEIEFRVVRGSGSSYAYLNSLIIREYTDNGIPNAPVNAVANAESRTKVRVSWSDQTDNEVGFEIYRSIGNNNSYQLLTTTAANVQSYVNDGLSANTQYYYKVRAKIDDATFSPYSNEAAVKTFVSAISVNLNAFNAAPAPWNNINAFLGVPGDRFNNLADDTGIGVGIDLVMVTPFTGDNANGMNTGANSGIVPDAVMEGAYWLDNGGLATIRIENLSFLYRYNVVFFGSRNGGGNRTTIYTINGNSTTLNASYNTDNTAVLSNITPSDLYNGSITIDVTTSAQASFGYLNGFIIQATSIDQGGQANGGGEKDGSAANLRSVSAEGSIVAYPNPFSDVVTVNTAGKQLVRLGISDPKGSVINSNVPFQRNAGMYQVQLSEVAQSKGIYYMRMIFEDGSTSVVKIAKQ